MYDSLFSSPFWDENKEHFASEDDFLNNFSNVWFMVKKKNTNMIKIRRSDTQPHSNFIDFNQIVWNMNENNDF